MVLNWVLVWVCRVWNCGKLKAMTDWTCIGWILFVYVVRLWGLWGLVEGSTQSDMANLFARYFLWKNFYQILIVGMFDSDRRCIFANSTVLLLFSSLFFLCIEWATISLIMTRLFSKSSLNYLKNGTCWCLRLEDAHLLKLTFYDFSNHYLIYRWSEFQIYIYEFVSSLFRLYFVRILEFPFMLLVTCVLLYWPHYFYSLVYYASMLLCMCTPVISFFGKTK